MAQRNGLVVQFLDTRSNEFNTRSNLSQWCGSWEQMSVCVAGGSMMGHKVSLIIL